jgi:hypothetical protein
MTIKSNFTYNRDRIAVAVLIAVLVVAMSNMEDPAKAENQQSY